MPQTGKAELILTLAPRPLRYRARADERCPNIAASANAHANYNPTHSHALARAVARCDLLQFIGVMNGLYEALEVCILITKR